MSLLLPPPLLCLSHRLPFCPPSQAHWGPSPHSNPLSGASLFQIGLVVILTSTVVAMSAVAQLWEDEWEVLLISLQVSGVGCFPSNLTSGST
jgi:hypothetical protein